MAESSIERIQRLQRLGLSRNEILDRLNGGQSRRDLSRRELREIGFNPNRIQQVLRNQRAGRRTYHTENSARGALNAARRARDEAREERQANQFARDTRNRADADSAFDQSAFDYMREILGQYGLESLTGTLRDLVSDGVTDEASLSLALQDTDAWKKRFIGNEKLRSAGLPVLSVAEYLATERSYAQIMKNYGLPQGFYDDPADFGDFIGKGVSAAELQERVQSYSDLANREDPAVRAELAARGMTTGDLMAFMMDPDRANPIIQRKYKSTLIGAAARRTGMSADQAYADRLAGMGITEEQAQAGYALISENLGAADRLGDIYGTDYGQRDFESEVFEGDGEATRKRKRLASQERAAFGGSSGVTQGSLRQSSAGQY